MSTQALLAWSSGKDAAMALHEVRSAGELHVRALLTTVTADYQRVSMHGVRRELVRRQAEALGLPLEEVAIPRGASNARYEAAMRAVLASYHELGVRSVIFGDVFLEDVRRCREANLAKAGMTGLFPLWKRDTAALARGIIESGFRAIVTCVDGAALDGRFAGRAFDEAFLADLPAGLDPCGENGEFHTFVHDGPIFQRPIPCRTGEVVVRDGRFHFCDVLPEDESGCLAATAHRGRGPGP